MTLQQILNNLTTINNLINEIKVTENGYYVFKKYFATKKGYYIPTFLNQFLKFDYSRIVDISTNKKCSILWVNLDKLNYYKNILKNDLLKGY